MTPKTRLEILPPLRSDDPVALDAFHEDRVRQDLALLSRQPGGFTQYVERARMRFRRANERAVLEKWIEFYQTGARLVAARNDLERRKSEYLQLAHEHDLKVMEKQTTQAKLQADMEEHDLRREKASYQRQHLEQFMERQQPARQVSDNEQKLQEAQERRDLDARWELHESLRALHSLIELQHWRRQQRDQILKDRTLTPEEQDEDLQFVDDLYHQKRGELKVDTRITKE